ncbi:MAG TPA: tetratricopeptide repeat protein [Acetobacteraceae bacterium]
MSSFGTPGLNVAKAALDGGSPQIALQVVDRILTTLPDSEAALVVQGDALTALGRPVEGTVSYNKALAVNPASVGARIGLGRLSLASAPAQSESLFLAALHDDPRNTTALNDLGVARDLQGNHIGAQQAYRQALGVNPDLNSAQVNLALSLAMTGDSGHAVAMIRPLAEEPGASPKVRQNFAAVLAMSGDREAARQILSPDMSPQDVDRALDAFAAARSGGPVPLTAAPPAPEAQPIAAQPVVQTTMAVARPMPGAARNVQVQFAAVPTEADARADWRRLRQLMPTLLNNRVPVFTRIDLNGQVFWRVRTGGFADDTAAEGFCQQVRQAGAHCAIGGA